MAYFNTSAPSDAASTALAILASVGTFIGGAFQSVSRGLMANSTAQRRLEQVERLQAKTDAELAVMGLQRADIVHHVFRDLM